MAFLRAVNLWRSYGEALALSGLDLEVAAGSVYGFIGPNGAGKSTTLRILATVDRPDAGRVWIAGLDAQRHPEKVRRVLGFMPDAYELDEDLTVRDLLHFFARVYRLPPKDRRRRVAQAIRLTRVGEVVDKKCASLSKGWKQRVLLAKTLVHDPALLLLDEPAAGLDPAARIEFRDIVRALRELGKTVLVSSHILTELADFCDSVGIVESGRMVVSGRIDDILARLEPCDRIELELLGDPKSALERIEALEEVERAEGAPARSAGTWRVEVRLRGRASPEQRAALARICHEAGLGLVGLRVRREGLEGLFLRVAKGPDARRRREALRAFLGGEEAR
ncbi:MAG: ABC transporter ATP-binding protein [Planctomycetota bacterium]|nr:MAG: ABC transporter ATP-binding protein [Planctomycetota bacterium]